MARRIIITIAPDGSPTIKTEGYAGKSCKDASAYLENALGTVSSENLTSEYHQTTEAKPKLNQGT